MRQFFTKRLFVSKGIKPKIMPEIGAENPNILMGIKQY
jgi:hypothetical protein